MGAPGRAGVANVARIPRGKPGRALAGRKYRAVAAPRPGRHHRVVSGLALTRAARPGRIALFACLLAALGLFTAIAQSRITWIDDVTAFSGSGVSLLWLGILGGAAALSVGLKDNLAGRSFGWRQIAAGTLTVLAVLAPLAAAVNWGWQVRGGSAPLALEQHAGATVPAVVAQAQRSDEHSRALVLDIEDDGSVSYQLFHRPIADFIDRSVAAIGATPDELDAGLAQAVGELATTADSETVDALANYAIADVLLLPPDPDGFDRRGDLIATMDATARLERVTANHYGILWRVNPESGPVSWARAEDGSTTTPVAAHGNRIETNIPAAPEARTLVLAERASENWRAWLDDVPLRSVSRDDGLQAFELPATGGELEVFHRPPQRTLWIIIQAFTLGVTTLLAIPMRRRRGGTR